MMDTSLVFFMPVALIPHFFLEKKKLFIFKINACVGAGQQGSPDVKEILFAIHFSRCPVYSKKTKLTAVRVNEGLNFLDCFLCYFINQACSFWFANMYRLCS